MVARYRHAVTSRETDRQTHKTQQEDGGRDAIRQYVCYVPDAKLQNRVCEVNVSYRKRTLYKTWSGRSTGSLGTTTGKRLGARTPVVGRPPLLDPRAAEWMGPSRNQYEHTHKEKGSISKSALGGPRTGSLGWTTGKRQLRNTGSIL
eukprot:1181969-Prorocentrum_minimum.AAC.2